LILGAATSTLPVGAPNTGAGGASVPTYPGRALPFMAIPKRRYQQIVWCKADRE
jgi:hypothetical protein